MKKSFSFLHRGHKIAATLPMGIFLLIFGFFLSAGSCLPDISEETEEATDKIVGTLDKGISSLNSANADWQDILQGVINELPAEVQSTIGNEVSNLLNRTVAATGVEIRCNADFLKNRVKQGLQRIKSKFLGGTPPTPEPQLCQVVPPAIDMNLDASRRNKVEFFGYDFDMTAIEVVLAGATGETNVTRFLDQPTHYHMTLNLGGSGLQIANNSQRILLKWGGRTISSIAILQKAPDICQTRVITRQPNDITYQPPHTRGDREFSGNGPDISGSATIINYRDRVVARLYMQARETKSDWTTAEGEVFYTIYTPDPGWEVSSVISPNFGNFSYRDNDHNLDTYAGNGPVRQFVFMGDGGGNDAGVHTRMTVSFNPIRLEIKENKDCVTGSAIMAIQDMDLITPGLLSDIVGKTAAAKMVPDTVPFDASKVDSVKKE